MNRTLSSWRAWWARPAWPLMALAVVSAASVAAAMVSGGLRGSRASPAPRAAVVNAAAAESPPDAPSRAFVRAQQAVVGVPPRASDRSGTVARGQVLAYTTVTPCRIADTRAVGAPVEAGGARMFVTVASDYSVQGGTPEGCALDGVDLQAVMVNITVVNPAQAGYATAYAPGHARPFAASLNYRLGGIVNNTVVARVAAETSGRPFELYSYARAHYVVDIVGYYAPPAAREYALDCRDVTIDRSVTAGKLFNEFSPPACADGFRIMAAQCLTPGSGSQGYEGQATIEWSRSGLVWAGYPPSEMVGCTGRDMVPSSVPGVTRVQVVHHCCRVVRRPAP